MFKKLFFISVTIILIVSLCSCGRNTKNKKAETKETTTAVNNISPGVLKLANEAISTYDKYKNADISKEQAISKFKDLSEHISDIEETLDDSYVYEFVDELYEKFNEESCDIENYVLPYDDLVDVIKGRYEPPEYNKLQEVDGVKFCLSEDWTEKGDQRFMKNNGVLLSIAPIKLPILADVKDVIKSLNNGNYGWSISEDYDIYESRKLKFFYMLNGKMDELHLKICYVQSVGEKAYLFYFMTKEPFEYYISDAELEEFLDQVWEVD